jgi:hypothetical protein
MPLCCNAQRHRHDKLLILFTIISNLCARYAHGGTGFDLAAKVGGVAKVAGGDRQRIPVRFHRFEWKRAVICWFFTKMTRSDNPFLNENRLCFRADKPK